MAILTKKVAATDLAAESSKILNVFQSTINGLRTVVEKAKTQAEVKQAEADAALAEKASLEQVAAQNE